MAGMTRWPALRHAGSDNHSRLGILPAICLAMVALPALIVAIAFEAARDGAAPADFAPPQLEAARSVALDTRLMPVSRQEAERLNALRPTDAARVSAAAPFIVAERFRSDQRFELALDCLAQAVYYEAGSESDAGQRAVAQVVLNRVRHPAFPNTVCGVVYQGASLATGCQFTFTCDGSLARRPSAWGWDRARRVALAALSGWVEPRVGTSTHYHASYVLPYWASSLDKVLTVGAHNFYAMRGTMGARGSMSARYDLANEFIPVNGVAALPFADADAGDVAADLTLTEPETAPAASLLAEDARTAGSRPLADAARPRDAHRASLRADEDHGDLSVAGAMSELIVD